MLCVVCFLWVCGQAGSTLWRAWAACVVCVCQVCVVCVLSVCVECVLRVCLECVESVLCECRGRGRSVFGVCGV